jgi:V/A-type H+/Na+-transporting ATPase subunit K
MESGPLFATMLVVTTVLVSSTVGLGVFLASRRDLSGSPVYSKLKRAAGMLLGADGALALGALVWALLALLLPSDAHAQETARAAAAAGAVAVDSLGEGLRKGLGYLAAGLATGFAAIGAGIGVGIAGAAGIGAISEKPEMLGRSLIYVGLGEGCAIYGLLIAFMILNRL